MVYLLLVAGAVAGLLVVSFGPWRRGVAVMGAALVIGALMRASLREPDAGMLRVRRNRWIDVLMLGGVGVALVVLAAVIPNQPA